MLIPAEPHKFEIHYVLNQEGDHSLNAFSLNRSQYHLLLLATEVSNICGVYISIEAQAITEGGIRETWKVLGTSGVQVGIVISTLALLGTAYPIYRDRGLADLQRETLTLDIELKKQEIEKNKKQLEKLREDVKVATPASAPQVITQAKEQAEDSHKVQILRSKFFERVLTEPKIKSIEFTEYKGETKVSDSKIIQRQDFDRFILNSDELPVETQDSAQIEIISPVLSKGKYKWKGKFCGNPIDFRMSDDAFKNAVINKQISFVNGMIIDCVMEIKRKIDDDGAEHIINYTVKVVTKIFEGDVAVETPQGTEYKQKTLNESRQLKFL